MDCQMTKKSFVLPNKLQEKFDNMIVLYSRNQDRVVIPKNILNASLIFVGKGGATPCGVCSLQ